MKKLALALVAFTAIAAHADSRVGTLENVTGSVSVGGAGSVSKAANGMRLVDGNTVLVSSKGKATVMLANGCSISMLGSQHLTVNSKLTCDQSLASVQNLAAPVQTAQALINGAPAASASAVPAGGAGAAGTAGSGGFFSAASFGGLGSAGAALGAFGLGVGALTVSANNGNTDNKTSGS